MLNDPFVTFGHLYFARCICAAAAEDPRRLPQKRLPAKTGGRPIGTLRPAALILTWSTALVGGIPPMQKTLLPADRDSATAGETKTVSRADSGMLPESGFLTYADSFPSEETPLAEDGPHAHSEGLAYVLSLGGTALEMGAGLYLASHSQGAIGGVLIVSTLLFGPSLGQFYAGSIEDGILASTLRLGGGGLVALGFVIDIAAVSPAHLQRAIATAQPLAHNLPEAAKFSAR